MLADYDYNTILRAKYKLSPREAEVAYLVGQGWTNQDIAQFMCVTIQAIKFHVTNIFKKCKVTNRKDLIRLIDKLCKRKR